MKDFTCVRWTRYSSSTLARSPSGSRCVFHRDALCLLTCGCLEGKHVLPFFKCAKRSQEHPMTSSSWTNMDLIAGLLVSTVYLLAGWCSECINSTVKKKMFFYFAGWPAKNVRWILLPVCFPTTCSIRQTMIICHYKLRDRCQPLSLQLTSTTFGLNLDPDWVAAFLTMQHTHKKKTLRSNDLRAHARAREICVTLFYYDELVHCTSHQYSITHFPTKYLSLPMASPGARSKRSHN